MAAILRLAKTKPFAFGMGYSLLKTAGCDIMVQTVVEKRETIDWRRTSAFASFGLFYLGGVQYALYVPVFSRLFPGAASFASKTVAEKLKDGAGIRALFGQVFLDQFVHHPIMYFPVFYMIKDFLTSDSPSPTAAITEYSHNMKEDLVALWKVWVPSTLLNFAFMPMWARIPWVASTSLVWTCILSAMRGSSDLPAQEAYGQVDARSMELVSRALISPAPRLDPRREHLLLNICGEDRRGLISDVTRTLYENKASVTTSKMMCLGKEFAITMHVECEPEAIDALKATLSSTGKLLTGLDVSVRKVQPLEEEMQKQKPAFTGQVSLSGVDRPGLIYHLAEVLTAQGLNIEHMQTEQHRRRGADAPRLFTTHCFVVGDQKPNVRLLKAELRRLEADLGVVCLLEQGDTRLHRSTSSTYVTGK